MVHSKYTELADQVDPGAKRYRANIDEIRKGMTNNKNLEVTCQFDVSFDILAARLTLSKHRRFTCLATGMVEADLPRR